MYSLCQFSATCAFAQFSFDGPDNNLDKGWKLVWSDEFNYTGLPDKTKWDYEEGFVRNGEKQYYPRERLENARVENGMLVIEGRKENYQSPTGKTAAYTAASLITKNKASWCYGRIEVRAKLPKGKGVWPAIWTLGNSGGWPGGGECDIMEYVGKQPGVVHATLHFKKNGKHVGNGKQLAVPGLESGFHVYAMEWTADWIDFFCDAKKYQSFAVKDAQEGDTNPFRKPHYLLLNLALGGGWGGPVIDDTIFPAKYLIDYVRVYERKSN